MGEDPGPLGTAATQAGPLVKAPVVLLLLLSVTCCGYPLPHRLGMVSANPHPATAEQLTLGSELSTCGHLCPG